MEKLQKALERARAQRQDVAASGGGTGGAYRPASAAGAALTQLRPNAAAQPRPSSGADALWQALSPFTPQKRDLVRNRVVTFQSGRDSTPFDILRTKILLQMREKGWTRLAITSPTPGCGKTTTACNLAVGLSRQPEIRSMLFDLDLRRPGVGRAFGYKPERGVRAVMEGEANFADHAVRLYDNLGLCCARGPVPDPTTLLISDTTSRVLDDIQGSYQPNVMLFDMPPMLVTDDTRAFLKNVDCALILARAGVTKVSEIDACEREVAEHTSVLGVVLNQYRSTEDGHGYDYY